MSTLARSVPFFVVAGLMEIGGGYLILIGVALIMYAPRNASP